MTDTLTALVRAVVLDARDAAPRLVLADYLEEQGHAEHAADLRRPRDGSGCVAMMDNVFHRRLFPRGKAGPHADVSVGLREVLSAIDSARAERLTAERRANDASIRRMMGQAPIRGTRYERGTPPW